MQQRKQSGLLLRWRPCRGRQIMIFDAECRIDVNAGQLVRITKSRKLLKVCNKKAIS